VAGAAAAAAARVIDHRERLLNPRRPARAGGSSINPTRPHDAYGSAPAGDLREGRRARELLARRRSALPDSTDGVRAHPRARGRARDPAPGSARPRHHRDARRATRQREARELTADQRVVIVPAGHPWSARVTVTRAELEAEPMILRERGSGSRDALERALADVGLELSALRIVGEFGSTQA